MAAVIVKPRNALLVVVWSFGLYLLIYMTQYAYFGIGVAVTGAEFGQLAGGEIKTYQTVFLRGLVGLLLGIPATFLVTRYLWRRPWDWLRLRFHSRYLLGGSIAGTTTALIVTAILYAAGIAHFTGSPDRFPVNQLVVLLIGHFGWVIFISILEETVFRGMAVREFARRWGWPLATIVGGLYFTAIHLIAIVPILTPRLSITILVAGMAASALFTALYIRSRSLWLPIGFHAGWNFALAAILGTTMSGRSRSFGLFRTELSGPDLLTGSEFGVETSVVTVAIMVIIMVCVLRIPLRGTIESLHSQPQDTNNREAKS